MTKKLKRGSALYAYLDALGVLDKSDEEIKKAKRDYYKQYKKEWKRKKLQANKSYLIVLGKHEYHVIKTAAGKHKRSITRYIKEAALSYSTNMYLVPDVVQVFEVKDLLNRTVIAFQQLLDGNKVDYLTGKDALQKLEALEIEVLTRLQYPASVEAWLNTASNLQTDTKKRILTLLHTANGY